MDNPYQPLTAIDRARLAYEEKARRQGLAATARIQRARRRRTRIAIVCCGIAVLLVACVIHYNLVPTPLRSAVVSGSGPGDEFVKTRTGHVRSFVSGDTCRNLQFDNVSGAFVGGALVSCAAAARKQAPTQTTGERVNSIRGAFTR